MKSAERVSHERLYPSIFEPSFLTLRSRRLIFSSWAQNLTYKNLSVLDVGGRLQPYRPLFANNVGRYVAIDLVTTELVSVVANGEALPFAASSFDIVIATQVFEFFRDPSAVAGHLHQILKPGGVLFASFAACTPRVVDDERWRFTKSGIRSMFGPFATVDIVPELHSVSGLIRIVNLGLDTFVRYATARRVYRLTASPFLNLLGLMFEYMSLTANDQFTNNYSVKATKNNGTT